LFTQKAILRFLQRYPINFNFGIISVFLHSSKTAETLHGAT